jgi:hypothetical protein
MKMYLTINSMQMVIVKSMVAVADNQTYGLDASIPLIMHGAGLPANPYQTSWEWPLL